MPLIKSISGIRGTIGGEPGVNLTPPDIVRFVAAYAALLSRDYQEGARTIIIGRDSRLSGEMVSNLVVGTLRSQGWNVVDLGLASSPTVEMAVLQQQAQGGVILTASHNPQGWNALKLLDQRGEIFSAVRGQQVLALAEQNDFNFVSEDRLGSYKLRPELGAEHLTAILNLPLIEVAAIRAKNFKVVVDGINSVGGTIVPDLLRQLGVAEIIELNCQPTGQFAHKPEPLAENLQAIQDKVREVKADLGVVVDPDVDRLAFINEHGEMISEEYTIVMAAAYILRNFLVLEAAYPGQYEKIVISNLSSSRALADIAAQQGGSYQASAVGEINVVEKMKELRSIIGGEGSGGVIYAPLHYGRDALVGLALILSALAKSGQSISEFQGQFPVYSIVKDRLEIAPGLEVAPLLTQMAAAYAGERITTVDGLKIDWPEGWVHLRASNTEPIIRIYAEANTAERAIALVQEIKNKILAYIK
jgi:phosphomannomutase